MAIQKTKFSLTEEHFEILRAKVKGFSGLSYPKERFNDLEKNIDNFLGSRKYTSVEEILNSLDVLSEFCVFLTIGETYFFRHKAHFDYLTKYVTDKISNLSSINDEIRIWSSACSSGEEPYSIAMALDDEDMFSKTNKLSIYASDLDHFSIHKAKTGIYSEWSFREIQTPLIKKYFTPIKGQSARGIREISPEIKSKVNFFVNNLMTTFISQKEVFAKSFDVIFCRNVMIYFGMDTIEELGKLFFRLLKEGGLLFVSPAEASLISNMKLFKCIDIGNSFVFEKSSIDEKKQAKHSHAHKAHIEQKKTSVPVQKPKPIQPLPKKEKLSAVLEEASVLFAAKKYKELISAYSEETLASISKSFLTQKQEELLKLYIKALTNESLFEKAEDLCLKSLDRMKLDIELRFLYAKILIENNKSSEGIEQLKKVLYLDSKNLIAHFLLGNLLLSMNSKSQAKKHFENALAILSSLPSDKILSEADGSSVMELKSVANTILLNLNSEGADE